MTTALKQLERMTVIVADTGDPAQIEKHQPMDCTTNPSLVLAALRSPSLAPLLDEEVAKAKSAGMDASGLCDTLAIAVGANLAPMVSGRVSTEVDARLSFDADASFRRAVAIIADYDRRGIPSEKILIKLASTWEGIRAAERLEKDGINCNLTLLFSMEQAKACADAGAFLISPFVGRITDWFKKSEGIAEYLAEEDPGVKSVREIFHYYKQHDIRTIVMGASFRNTDQIKALAGCDRLTISPNLLDELARDESKVVRAFGGERVSKSIVHALPEAGFRWGMNQNAMASEKLAEGIRGFERDHRTLLSMLGAKI